MNELRKEIWESGIHYTLIGDYYFPDVRSPEDCGSFGKWADLHLAYKPCIRHRCQVRARESICILRGCSCSSIVVYLIQIVFYPFYVYSSCIARILSTGGRCA